ncbi:unnamed protein product, partial [Iphiclides podalirius]
MKRGRDLDDEVGKTVVATICDQGGPSMAAYALATMVASTWPRRPVNSGLYMAIAIAPTHLAATVGRGV